MTLHPDTSHVTRSPDDVSTGRWRQQCLTAMPTSGLLQGILSDVDLSILYSDLLIYMNKNYKRGITAAETRMHEIQQLV